MNISQAIILAIVEGLTEFLPVSSTGHLIIASTIMGINEQDFTKIFEVNIQFGAILAVLIVYWKNFISSKDFYLKLFTAFLPAAIIGFTLNKYIDKLLGSVFVVGLSLLIGGFILILFDKAFKDTLESNQITYKKAINIGLFQCIAMIPGVSRSAATIIGGQLQGLSRKEAAEFSFFLAVPTMFAASSYKLLKDYKAITFDNINILLIGNLTAFIVAMIAIKFFISFLTKYGFKFFGYYRIVVGLIILIFYSF